VAFRSHLKGEALKRLPPCPELLDTDDDVGKVKPNQLPGPTLPAGATPVSPLAPPPKPALYRLQFDTSALLQE
jgi:hypothetical protein